MSARENILARIRANSGKQGMTTEAELAVARMVISKRTRGPLPGFARHDPVQHFIAECDRLKTTLTEVASLADVPDEIGRYLSTIPEAKKLLVGWPEFLSLDWQRAGIGYTQLDKVPQ